VRSRLLAPGPGSLLTTYLKKHPEYRNLVGKNNLKRLFDEK
jgi:hypothetical protein